MIRCPSDARARAATDPTAGEDSLEARRRRHLERFVRDLGYPDTISDAVISRFRRERGAMTADDAGVRLADWITRVRQTDGPSNEAVSVDDAIDTFVMSGAAMWHVDVLFADPSALSVAHRSALAAHRARVVPTERPLAMPAQSLDGPRWGRRARVEPTVRRLSWIPSR
jgi:hypothetical protein